MARNGPKKLWTNNTSGLGYAGFSIRGNNLYTLGLEEGDEFALCLNVTTGEEVWRKTVGSQFKNRWGDSPRTTPTIDGQNIYVMTGGGTLGCLNAETGEVVWSVEMKEFGGKTPFWGYSESPLADGNRVICSPGGNKGAMVALDKSNGDLLWQTSEVKNSQHYSYTSPIVIEWGGKRQYVKLLGKVVMGVDAEDGSVIWQVVVEPFLDSSFEIEH